MNQSIGAHIGMPNKPMRQLSFTCWGFDAQDIIRLCQLDTFDQFHLFQNRSELPAEGLDRGRNKDRCCKGGHINQLERMFHAQLERLFRSFQLVGNMDKRS